MIALFLPRRPRHTLDMKMDMIYWNIVAIVATRVRLSSSKCTTWKTIFVSYINSEVYMPGTVYIIIYIIYIYVCSWFMAVFYFLARSERAG